MSDNYKVTFAAAVGTGSPAANWFIDAEPSLRVVLLIGQILVAAITAVYIFRKWKNARASKKNTEE